MEKRCGHMLLLTYLDDGHYRGRGRARPAPASNRALAMPRDDLSGSGFGDRVHAITDSAVLGEPERDRRPHAHTNEVYRQTTEYRVVNAD
jgi:hypothetical protein